MSSHQTGKTARKTVGRSFQRGTDPRRGCGKKGRSGRKPDWLKQFCDDLLADKTAQGQIRAILHNKDHPAFSTMWKAVADRAHGKPTAAVELSGSQGSPIPVQIWRIGNREIRF
jgi:hypothetical protein